MATISACSMVASCLDGSFTVNGHEWGMPLTDHLPRVSKTRLIQVAAVGAAIVIAVASLSPHSPAIGTGFGDKLDHLAAYSALSLLVALGWSGRIAPGMIVGTAIGFSGLLELLQTFSSGRQSDWTDFTVNSLGTLAGLIVASLVRRTSASGRPPLDIDLSPRRLCRRVDGD